VGAAHALRDGEHDDTVSGLPSLDGLGEGAGGRTRGVHALVDPADDLLEGHAIVLVGGAADGQLHRHHGDAQLLDQALVEGSGAVGDDGYGHDLSVRARSDDMGAGCM
jgi:hypothetical protein